MLSIKTLPMGYSKRQWPFSGRYRTIAMLSPFGDQSASCTLSSTSRGVPPLSGTRASVPAYKNDESRGLLCSASSISPDPDTASTSAPFGSNNCDCGLSGRVVYKSSGLPSHAAL